MPLEKGKSEKAFKHNIKTEYKEGKPLKQSLAIAYAMKRKGKKMAMGGAMHGSGCSCPQCMAEGGPVLDQEKVQSAQDSMRKAFHFAEGGQIKDNYQNSKIGNINHPDMRDHEKESGFMMHEGDDVKHNSMAMNEDHKDLNQHKPMPHDSLKDDLVDRIMKKMSPDYSSEARYSEGGRVANETPITAGFKPNEFDDLVLRDNLESSYGDDDNSGDALGNKFEDERRDDIVSRIMSSRRKKDRNPRPA